MSGPTLYIEKVVKARKSHKCSGCGAAIAKGETYKSISGAWDGKFKAYNHCDNCDRVTQKILDEGLESYYTLENPRQYLIDIQGYDETACDIADLMRLPVAYVAEVIN